MGGGWIYEYTPASSVLLEFFDGAIVLWLFFLYLGRVYNRNAGLLLGLLLLLGVTTVDLFEAGKIIVVAAAE